MANSLIDSPSKANGSTQSFKTKIENVEGNLEKMAHNAGEKIGAFTSEVSDSATEYVNNGRDYVRANPVKGVAIAAASGLVVGSLLTMIFRKSN